MMACHHLRGGNWGLRLVVPACRHDPAWRNTGLRTAPTTYRGWKLHRLLSSSATSGVSTMSSRPKPVFAAPGAAPALRRWRRLPQRGFPVHSPALTKLCRVYQIYKSLRAKGTPLVEQCDAAKLQRHRPLYLHSAPFPAF